VEEGFQMNLFASEPLIADPVDMCIDENGVMYVVEMSGYPLDKSHTGKIKILRDEDGDSVMDESILFAEELMFPNGIMPWKQGVIVTDAPYVLYLEDSDGDGRSDKRDTILSGYSLSNPHVNVNNPIYGLDNWVYLSHFGRIGTRKYEEDFGDEGSEIRFWNLPGSPELPKNANSKNVRFKPDGSGLEMRSVKGQFGHTFDEWGHHFLTHNSNHIYQEVIGPRYLNRNKSAIILSASEDISDHGNSTEVMQITTNPDRQLFTPVGLSTSTSGLTYYDGGLFPTPYDKDVTFVAESVSNLVHTDRLVDTGATFRAERHRPDKEFLASRDFWARPVNMYVGPDGALYVLDYYRRIIEHPEWMSEEAIEAGDLYDGHDMGRIYRITPKGSKKADWTEGLDLGNRTSEELVKYLSHKNGWWRRNAQRLLVDRSDPSVIPLLMTQILEGRNTYGRLHAMWTLEGMKALEVDIINKVLNDPEPGIRENAIRLAEKYIDQDMDLETHLYDLVSDPSPKVRFQLLSTLGDLENEKSRKAREELLLEKVEDEWFQLAALTAQDLDVKGLLSELMKRTIKENTGRYQSLMRRLAEVLGTSDDTETIAALLGQVTAVNKNEISELQPVILSGLVSGLRGNEAGLKNLSDEKEQLLTSFFSHPDPTVRQYVLDILQMGILEGDLRRIKSVQDKAWSEVEDTTNTSEYRAQMIHLLTIGELTAYITGLRECIVPAEDPQVQVAAIEVLGQVKGSMISEFVLENWNQMTQEVREAGLNTFLTEDSRVELLLGALEAGKISKTSLGWNRVVQLNRYGNETIRKKARALLAEDNSKEVVAKYSAALEIPGSEEKGIEVFKANCSICHQVRGSEGVAYGPDLGTVHNWEGQDLLANILEPGLSIAPGFDLWEVVLKNGDKVQGMIGSETSSAIELLQGPGVKRTINRREIETIQSLQGMSMMPGFGGVIEAEEMADLIAYLKNSERI